ncbi:MAG TPA: lysylphosphatidylglycerol synthase transmembrane domain-containing protein [Candidatus Acidoferrales bacterium]|nr:lysylphosphatidylglycerol synthase transmembrane domain-containing protein [Candidatus Acidoferrales bacterium]
MPGTVEPHPAQSRPEPRAHRHSRSRAIQHPVLRMIFRIGGSILALFLLFHFLPLSEVWTTLRHLPAYLWLLILAGYLAAHVVAINKWRLMINVGGAGLSFRHAVRCYFSGLFGTLFLPSIVGGDFIRSSLAMRFGAGRAAIILGGFLDRVLDFVVLMFLAALGALLVPGALDPRTRHVFVSIGVVILVALAVLGPLVFWFPARHFSFRIRRGIVRLRQAARPMRRSPRTVFAALCLGLFAQGSFIWLTAQVANVSGLRLPFRAWLFAWPLAKISAVIPVTQGGIGVREAALAALLVPFGARAVKTVAVGLAWEAIIITGGLIAGLTAFLLGRLPAARAAVAQTKSSAENPSRSDLEPL